MTSFGIYTLANDVVYDQLVALLNSIERNISFNIPICVIPYDNRLEKVKQEVYSRHQVTLFDDWISLQRWDEFVNQVWETHSQAKNKFARPPWYKGFVHRKFAAFDGKFERFVFFDADSLAMKPLDDILKKLNTYDLVFDDWEHNKKRLSTELDLAAIERATNLAEAEIRPKLHCDSFFAAKRGFFPPQELESLRQRLIQAREVEWIYPRCWWSSSALFSYMTFHTPYTMFNFTRSHNHSERTGNCADADPFVEIEHVLFNKDGLKPIHRIHYMNYSSSEFTRLCKAEQANILYKDIFLYYRFLKFPEQKPQIFKQHSLVTQLYWKLQKAIGKSKRLIY